MPVDIFTGGDQARQHFKQTIPDATPSAAGVMSAADKAKLDGLSGGGSTPLGYSQFDVGNYSNTNQALTDILTLTFTVPAGGGKVRLKMSGMGFVNTTPFLGTDVFAAVELFLDGVLNPITYKDGCCQGSGSAGFFPFSFDSEVERTLAAGTYTLRAKGTLLQPNDGVTSLTVTGSIGQGGSVFCALFADLVSS